MGECLHQQPQREWPKSLSIAEFKWITWPAYLFSCQIWVVEKFLCKQQEERRGWELGAGWKKDGGGGKCDLGRWAGLIGRRNGYNLQFDLQATGKCWSMAMYAFPDSLQERPFQQFLGKPRFKSAGRPISQILTWK